MLRSIGLLELLIYAAVAVCVIWPMWKIYTKAGYPGFLSLGTVIPGINVILLLYLGFSDWPVRKELRALRQTHLPDAPPAV